MEHIMSLKALCYLMMMSLHFKEWEKTGISLANAESSFIAQISVFAAEAYKAGLDSLRSTVQEMAR